MSVGGNACPRTVFITAVERVLGVWSMRAISKTVEGYYRHRPGRRSRAGDLGRAQLRTGSAADLLHVHFKGQYRPAENSWEYRLAASTCAHDQRALLANWFTVKWP